MSGVVHLVGAGPGAVDLLTLRAARLLREADIVFHDALVSEEILSLIETGNRVAVGKRSGVRSTAQRFINKQLFDAAQRYRTVVRLKGGDPLLFGRAHEEITYLAARGIEVHIVPGVTAALAASADLGVSLTQRGISRSVLFATPRAAKDAAPSNWAAAAAAADTAALYMAAADARAVMEALLGAGIAPDRPVVVIENASLDPVYIAGPLRNLPQLASHASAGPTLVLLGDVYAGLAAVAERDLRQRLASQSE